MTKTDILAFIKTKKHAVISTCGGQGQPEAALIGFGESDNFELIFGTYKTSRKYRNILTNNKVAFVIGWDEEYITVQLEGIATELKGEELDQLVTLYHQKVPGAVIYKSHPEQTYFKVSPSWVRYSDLSGEEEKIVEFNF